MATEKVYPNDDHFVFRKDKTTLILDTTEKFQIGKNFNFATSTCLVYAETVEISGDLSFPGKELGLFSSRIIVPEPVKLDVSGEVGKVGDHKTDADGGPGHAGNDAGRVWIFVQDFNRDDLKNLEINARGGGGGRGGDTSGLDKIGGRGGNGGKGGSIEVVVGTTPVDAILALRKIDKQPWPEKVASLLEPAVPDVLAGFITERQKEILAQYQSLAQTSCKLIKALRSTSDGNQNASVKASASGLLDQIKKIATSVREAPILTQIDVEDLKKATSGLSSGSDLTKELGKAADHIAVLSPAEESQLNTVIDEIFNAVEAEKLAIQNSVEPKLKNIKGGASGSGGDSGPGLQPGPRGTSGTEGETKLKFLELNGSKRDVEVSQAYIFPEQCQMLLNKADGQFFSHQWKSRGPAVQQYQQLIRRLNVVKTLGTAGEANESSGFWTAIYGFEKTLKMTRNSVGQLKIIHGQAKSRLNRLILGQDMLGHGHNWVPRLSFDHYAENLKKQFTVLEEVEGLEAQYKDAFQKDAVTGSVIDDGIKKMDHAAKEAKTKIALLTGTNGPLSQTAHRITELTVEIKEKRQNVQDEVERLQLKCDFDLLKAFSTLTGLKKDMSSLKKLYALYREAVTDVKDKDGELFKKEYVMGQITDCTDSLESLESALNTAKYNTIAMDDPNALKVMAKRADIDKLMENFAKAIPEESRKSIKGALDAYIATVLLRNEAVVDYNSFIHLLFEARHNEEYALSQATSLADKKLDLDPAIPAVSFWLRKVRDNFQLQLMQRLDFASRAVKFWGLKEDLKQSEPGPLRNSSKLKIDQEDLNDAFEDILTRYAGNLRSVWPVVDEQQGLFYDLSGSERKTLMAGREEHGQSDKVYKVSISLAPGVLPFGKGRADVRLHEVRLWLVGASVQPDTHERQRVLVHLDHLGQDTFEDEEHNRLEFSHDVVSFPFEYDAALVNNKKDLTSRAKLGGQSRLQDAWTGGQSRRESSIAAVGPFATWRIVLLESENPGLDMSKVTSAHLEFRGANRSFIHT